MIQMPEALREAWSPLWATGHVRERPWWVFDGYHGTNPYTNQFQSGVYYKRRDKHILWVSDESVDAALATYDAESPIPPPPPMPGQVWAFPDGEAQITAVERAMLCRLHERPEDAKLRLCPVWSKPLIRLNRQWHVTAAEWEERQWPIRGAILVAGPSAYGRDIPWCPAEGGSNAT